MLGPIKRVGPDLRGTWVWGEETEGEEDAYNVELAAPVLMLKELERPNMAFDARRPAPRNTGLAMAMVSLLHDVCDGWVVFKED